MERNCWMGWPGMRSDMPRMRTGSVRATLAQKRVVIEASSGFSASSAEAVRGSRAMPQMGQAPGAGRIISGCMGQVYSTAADGAWELAPGALAASWVGSWGGCGGAGGLGARYFSAAARNFSAQPGEQK